MDIISQWVTQIIIFLLLAVIIDLLIPKTSMKKYIKLVMGLILMLIFLKPVFYLFSIDFQTELTSSFEQIYEGDHNNEMIENLTKEQKVDIQASQAAYILEEMTIQLKDVAEEPLLTGFHVEIIDIDYLFLDEGDISFENLEEIIVYLDESDGREETIRTIEEIMIGQDHSTESIGDEQDEDITLLLQSLWELDDKKISIKREGGTS